MEEGSVPGLMTQNNPVPTTAAPLRMPEWLRRPVPRGAEVSRVRAVVARHRLHTVCESAACPNRMECYSGGRATFMILGSVCTRSCTYCKVTTGRPGPLEPDEAARVASAAVELGLSYVVVTSVCRDDLPDGGAGLFASTVRALRTESADIRTELLVPDFKGSQKALEHVLNAGPTVLNHNLETVPRLYRTVRPQGDYDRALRLLDRTKSHRPGLPTKSGLMVGLGETDREIEQVLRDLRDVRCDIVTLGQYVRPSLAHQPVQRYVTPAEFSDIEAAGRALGFMHVLAGPLVRSSFMAEDTARGLGTTA
jgi:lipoic acid synthetase